MGDGTAIAEQWLAERSAILARIDRARTNLMYGIENTLGDLGQLGRARGHVIMDVVNEELDEVAELIGADDA